MPTVLVVDDEPDVRLVARLVLTSAGFDVVEASSGEEALTLLDADPGPDAVLLDVRMKGIDGWETLRRLRASSRARTAVVIFTAHLSARQEAPGEWKDYEHFLTKPFEPDRLLAAVNEAMDAGASGN